MNTNRIIKRSAFAAGVLALLCAAAALLIYNGTIRLNNPDRKVYPVRGVDVSSYQGVIDWQVLAGEDIRFAFLKATEGSAYQDKRFAENWEGASQTGLIIGAYHFFSYDSPGTTQAENFISTAPLGTGNLFPVVDVEFYGDYEKNPPDREKVCTILDEMLVSLEEYYGVKPVLYATGKAYRLYLAEGYEEYPLWIRDVVWKPRLPDGRDWAFWQYSDRGVLRGYDGEERFIDLNVFAGTEEELQRFLLP